MSNRRLGSFCQREGDQVGWDINFFVNFVNEWRISKCGREVFGHLQTISAERGAYVALMAAFFKVELFHNSVPGSMATVGEMAERPMAYRRELCHDTFCLLEKQRAIGRDKFQACEANKIVLPPQALELREVSDLALSLWMITIGVGYLPSSLERVAFCWNLVASFVPTDDDIQAITNNLHYEEGELMDQPIKTSEWIAMAHKLPAFLEK